MLILSASFARWIAKETLLRPAGTLSFQLKTIKALHDGSPLAIEPDLGR